MSARFWFSFVTWLGTSPTFASSPVSLSCHEEFTPSHLPEIRLSEGLAGSQLLISVRSDVAGRGAVSSEFVAELSPEQLQSLREGLDRWGYDGWAVRDLVGTSGSGERIRLSVEAFRTGGGHFRIYAELGANGLTHRLACY